MNLGDEIRRLVDVATDVTRSPEARDSAARRIPALQAAHFASTGRTDYGPLYTAPNS